MPLEFLILNAVILQIYLESITMAGMMTANLTTPGVLEIMVKALRETGLGSPAYLSKTEQADSVSVKAP